MLQMAEKKDPFNTGWFLLTKKKKELFLVWDL